MEKRHRQPFTVTLTIGGVFLLGAGNLLQAGQSLALFSLHQSLPLSVPAWYPPLTGALWGSLWIVLGTGLLLGKGWARRCALLAIPLQVGFWLADWLIFSRSEIAIQSFGFDFSVRLAAACLAMAALFFSGRRRGAGKDESAAGSPERETFQSHVE
jgi:hypothetical protein